MAAEAAAEMQGKSTEDTDMLDAGINNHLNEMNRGGEEKEGEGMAGTPAANLNFMTGA